MGVYASVTREGEYLVIRDTTRTLNEQYDRELMVGSGMRGALHIARRGAVRDISFPHISFRGEGMLVAEGENQKLDIFFVAPGDKRELSDKLTSS